jgi:hypothetical protein
MPQRQRLKNIPHTHGGIGCGCGKRRALAVTTCAFGWSPLYDTRQLRAQGGPPGRSSCLQVASDCRNARLPSDKEVVMAGAASKDPMPAPVLSVTRFSIVARLPEGGGLAEDRWQFSSPDLLSRARIGRSAPTWTPPKQLVEFELGGTAAHCPDEVVERAGSWLQPEPIPQRFDAEEGASWTSYKAKKKCMRPKPRSRLPHVLVRP